MKDKKIIALIVVIVILVFGLAYAKSKSPRAVDWKPTFINTKTSPYGTYITYKLLDSIFYKENIRTTRVPIYNNLKKGLDAYFGKDETYDSDSYESYDYGQQNDDSDTDYIDETYTMSDIPDEDYSDADSLEYVEEDSDPTAWYHYMDNLPDTSSYLFINREFSLDKLDLEYLLDFAGLGNNVFISAEFFDSKLKDTLGIRSSKPYTYGDTIYTLSDYPANKYRFQSLNGSTKLNTDSCTHPVRVLALNNVKDTVFIDISYGKGHIYLHTIPTAFANVNMLQTDKYDFGFRCLSYLPQNSKIVWDEYQKQGSIAEGSTFKVMLENPPLRTALYIILGGFLLFMIFRAKRTQRVIPVIQPPVNSSLEFLGTISNLYYKKKDLHTIVEKRHAYFLDFIRKNYYMSTENIDNDFTNVLSAKSGVDKDKLNELFLLFKDMTSLAYIPNETFLKYNHLLEEFYRNVKNK